ncbi:hypothetical protein [Corynebacterium guangdongense]|uniref:Glycosyltransferase RgtA/B/C/D-like domain-containing protein n=1 Tax=Corynebacterium guangdongense TaxID=1783348 RepID=A0ABU1ZZU2_9CORY|nr:hypothetical protein [Corynebacterium guangdongense]MDR7330434.1 hypothetical protein [Corynebacterium guangdongense]WJZ18992.1 hypothetical protein CGUA_12285 [Corynebacterium guangdongense]
MAWAVLLVGALTWPLLAPGELAARDMLVLDQPALSAAALGFGDTAARNVPQDGVLALAGQVVPASWLVRVLIIGAAGLAAGAAAWLTRLLRARAGLAPSAPAAAAAMTVAVLNPFIVERLLQGHWSLVIAAWLLPGVAAASLAGRPLLAGLGVIGASLTPSGALLATLTAVAAARGRRHRVGALLVGLAASLPWLVPGVLAASTAPSASAAAFAPRAEAWVGTAGALLGLGGIWNAEAVPASRAAGFAVFGVLLFLVLATAWRRCPRPLLLLAVLGLGGATLTWLAPGLTGWAVEHVPGAGLVRDGQKLVMLAIPAYVALAGLMRREWLAATVLALAVLQVPDAPRELTVLRPATVAVDEELVAFAGGRDVFFPGRSGLATRADGLVIVDPATKAMSVVESGALVVDGRVVDPPSPRWVAAGEAWARRDLARLAELGVGVVVDGGTVVETGAAARPLPVPGLLLLAWWLALPWGLLAIAAARRRD